MSLIDHQRCHFYCLRAKRMFKNADSRNSLTMTFAHGQQANTGSKKKAVRSTRDLYLR